MNQSIDNTLHMCNSAYKKIGHNLDTSYLILSVGDNSKQQIFSFENLPLTQPIFGEDTTLQNTSHFETLQTLSTTYFKEKTLSNSFIHYSDSQKSNQYFSVNVLLGNSISENLNNNNFLFFQIENQE